MRYLWASAPARSAHAAPRACSTESQICRSARQRVVGETGTVMKSVSSTAAVEQRGDVVGLGLLTIDGLDGVALGHFAVRRACVQTESLFLPLLSTSLLSAHDLRIKITLHNASCPKINSLWELKLGLRRSLRAKPPMTILSTVVPASITPIVDFCLKEADDETTAESTSKTSCAMVLPVEWHSWSERKRHCSNFLAASAASIGAPAAAAIMSQRGGLSPEYSKRCKILFLPNSI
jgi:hypothetical protein